MPGAPGARVVARSRAPAEVARDAWAGGPPQPPSAPVPPPMSHPPSGDPRPPSWTALEHALVALSADPAPDLAGTLRAIAATAERVLADTTVTVSLADTADAGSAGDPPTGDGAAGAVLAAPIGGDGAAAGHVRCTRPAALGPWSDAERAFVAALATVASLAVERDRRRRLEAELRERDRHMDEVQSIAGLGTWEWDVATSRVTWSDEQFRLHGRTPQPHVDFEWYVAHVHPDDRPHIEALTAHALATGEALEFPYRIVRADGAVRWLYGRSRVELAPDGTPRRMIGASQDVTEARRAEDALRASEEAYRAIFDSSHDGIIVQDPETGAILDANRRVCELHGFTREEIQAGGVAAIGDVVPPFTPELAAEHVARASGGEALRFEWCTLHRHTGEAMWVEVGLQRVTIHGQPRLLALVRDIRDRKRAEAELRASEESYRAIFDASNDAILVHDAETGAIVDVNARACELHGLSREALLDEGMRLLETVPPFTRERAMGYMQRAARGESLRFEWCTRRPTGEPVWAEVSLQPVAIRGARRILALVRDIAERKAAEEQLRRANEELEARVQERTAALALANEALSRSEEHFRRLIENSQDLIQVVDPERRVSYTGPSITRALGYAPEEMLGRTGADFLHPDDLPRVTAAVAAAEAEPGTAQALEYRIRHKDGSWRWLETVFRTLSPTTAGEGLVVNARDVTARREAEGIVRASEERFRALVENAYDLTSISSADGRITYHSPSVRRVLGYAPEELEGRLAFDYIHPDDAPAVAAELARIVAAPSTVGHAEYRFLHKDGGWRLLEAFGRTLARHTADEGVVFNIRDVTERRRTEEALRQATAAAELARAEAEQANLAKSEFLSRMSHELRTPMNSILGFAQILGEADLSTADRNAVQHILTAGEHLLSLINEVLDISRIEAGRQEMSLEPVRLGSVLQEAIALVRPLAAARSVWVAEGVGAAGDCFVRADRQRLAQVLLNLLSNAVKYNQPGGSVRIGTELLVGETLDWGVTGEASAARVRVRVEDSGHGIAPERQDQLFVPFARLGAEQTGVEGTGLGLALSQRLMTAMGGTLALESSSPQGSVFSVELRAVPSPVAAAAPLPPSSRSLALHRESGAKILYVEDNLANLSLIEAVLAPYAGWTLVPALQGQLGVELAHEHAPDLVLLDLHLPDISGEEVLRRLRADARTASVPVVVISADATPTRVERLLAAGADAYLTKPLDVKLFLRTVERLLTAEART